VKLLSPARRRRAVEHLQGSFCVSERRACQVVEQPRSSQRHASTKVCGDTTLVQRIVALSRENPRYGYRRVCALLRREGWAVNKKRSSFRSYSRIRAVSEAMVSSMGSSASRSGSGRCSAVFLDD